MEQRVMTKKRTTNFREDETRLLIKLWGNPAIQNKLYLTHRKAPVMRIIASNMQKHGFYRTPDEIKTRIRNLKCLYHRIKKSLTNGIGIGTVDPDWPHFKAMDRILNKKAQRRQHDLIYKENFLNASSSTLDMDIINIKREDDDDDDETFSNRSSPEPPHLPPDDGRCAFQGCPNPSTAGLFPAPNPRLHWDRFVAWTRASGNPAFEGLDPGQIASRLRACERHFAPAALALMRTGGGDRAGVVPSVNLPPPLDIDFGVEVPENKHTDRNDNSLVDVVIKTELGSDDEFEETAAMPQLTPAPKFADPPAPPKPQQQQQPTIKIMPKPASSLFPPKVAQQKTTVTSTTTKPAAQNSQTPRAPFPLLILNGMPAGAQAAHIVQTKPQQGAGANQRPHPPRAQPIAPASTAVTVASAPPHTECSKLIKDLLDVQKETFELQKQRLDLEKQRLDFERLVGSQLLTLIPVVGGILGKTVAQHLRNGQNGRKRKASESLDPLKDPKVVKEMLEEGIKKYLEQEAEDIKDEESDGDEEGDGSAESDSGVATNESRESNK